MTKISYLTRNGLKKLKDELEHLISVERPSISRQIAEAREKGDLSENAEYDAAKELQGMVEMKISKLKETIVNSRIIDESKIDTIKIQMLNKVKIKNLGNKQEMEYTIVSTTEADLKAGKLSIETPIAKALLGKKKGDKVKVATPAGIQEYQIMNISI